MSKRVLGLAAAAVLVLGLAACVPTFPEGSELTAEVDGAVVVLGWEEPTVANPDEPLREYVIYVDEVEVSRVPGFVLGCRLLGLEDQTSYTIGLEAIDEGNRKSAILSAEVFTDFTEEPDAEVTCSTAPPGM